MSRRASGIAAALITMPFMGLPAWGDACVMAPVATYTAPNFQCSVGDKTFTNIDVFVSGTGTFGNQSVTFNNISPFNSGNEFGLQLSLSATAGPSSNNENTGGAVVIWRFNVFSEIPIIDVFLQLDGNTGGTGSTGSIDLTEQLSNGPFALTVFGPDGPGTKTQMFDPQDALHVEKSSAVGSGANGFARETLI